MAAAAASSGTAVRDSAILDFLVTFIPTIEILSKDMKLRRTQVSVWAKLTQLLVAVR